MINMNQKLTLLPEKFPGVRIDFWGMKSLWRRDRHYVARPNMEVWQRLACPAPDAPDEWSFPDGPGPPLGFEPEPAHHHWSPWGLRTLLNCLELMEQTI
jgi:hypothetical protein